MMTASAARRRTPNTTTSGNNKSDNAPTSRSAAKSSRRKKAAPQSKLKPILLSVLIVVGMWLLVPIFMVWSGTWSPPKRLLRRPESTNTGSATKEEEPAAVTVHEQPEVVPVVPKVEAEQQAAVMKPTPPTPAKHEVQKSSTEIIDMRQLSATLPFADVDGGHWKQGWEIQPPKLDPNNPLKVFILPHSHCDPGWIKTFDDYFKTQTNGIITSVIQALSKDSRRKFIWAEISYFSWWWEEASEDLREKARAVLKSGQLEFVTGGWVQPDEANTELYAMEVQLQEGHDWISATLGEEYIPKYGWSIDPFGYSSTMAYLLKQYKMEGMLIQRVHYAVKKELALKKHLEFYWRQTWDETGDHDIFTHLMPFYSYDVPHTCGPDPAVCCQFDFARNKPTMKHTGSCPWHKQPTAITPQNVHERSMLILDQWQKKASLYRGNAVLVPLGDDFRYRTLEEADVQYDNFQQIFDYLNTNVPGVDVQFGTLSEYFQHVTGTFETPLLKGAFFTYSDREQDYWSGYFTSRVFDKALDRTLERVLYAADSLGATRLELQDARRALSLFQHHDGVTGTAKNHVVDDYAKRIHTAIHQVQTWLLQKTVPTDDEAGACWQSDAPRGLTQNLCGSSTNVQVYNPLKWPQRCGSIEVPALETIQVPNYPCDTLSSEVKDMFKFDEHGLMVEPIKEEWLKWQVKRGGAYLFFPGIITKHNVDESQKDETGWVVATPDWRRTIVEHKYDVDEFGNAAIVLDFIYDVNLQIGNEEWFVRFTGPIENDGVFHTDLNGFNFDTHHFRKDLPVQSQVFPMPTHASIEDSKMRMTILSEHAQGTASLEPGAIDVWLDRRLTMDDARGLGQGVMDNVPTRTRLRVVIEKEHYNAEANEFGITPLCRRMWDELNHPLEAFGKLNYKTADDARGAMAVNDMIGNPQGVWKDEGVVVEAFGRRMAAVTPPKGERGKMSPNVEAMYNRTRQFDHGVVNGRNVSRYVAPMSNKSANVTPIDGGDIDLSDKSTPIVPFVIMVFKRVDYLKEVIASIIGSDTPTDRVPVIISQDGDIPEMTEYVESLKTELPLLRRIVHPYSCYEHPDDFPGDSKGLFNHAYKGDSYGNMREGRVTCLKHHFTWMFKTVFEMDFGADLQVDNFFFLEEDYIVSPTIYEGIARGLYFYDKGIADPKLEGEKLFGIVFDATDGHSRKSRTYAESGFYLKTFVSNPMIIGRASYNEIVKNAKNYCEFDDYNWDWSIVHLQKMQLLGRIVLCTDQPLVKHIGVDGTHEMKKKQISRMNAMKFAPDYHPRWYHPVGWSWPKARPTKGYGGWGHHVDHNHCKMLLNTTAAAEA